MGTLAIAGSITGASGGGLDLLIAEGWAGEEDCVADVTKVTVKFNKDTTFAFGIVGIAITSDGGQVFTITSIAGTGTQVVTYTGSWDSPIIAGDVITWAYDGTGDYRDEANQVSRNVLHFNGDTFISTIQTTMFNSAGHITWENELDGQSRTNQDTWGNSGDTTFVWRPRNSLATQLSIGGAFTASVGNWASATRESWKFTWDGSTNGEVFRNGISVSTPTIATGTTTELFMLGRGDASAINYMIGTLKDVKFFNGSGVLTDHWPIDDNNGTTIRNVTTPANAGTLTIGTGGWSSESSGKLMASHSKIITNCLNLVTPIILSVAMLSGDEFRVTYDQAIDQDNLDTIQATVEGTIISVISPMTVSNQTVVDYTLVTGVLPDDTVTFDATGTNLVAPFSDTFNVANGVLDGHTPTIAGEDWVAATGFNITSSIIEKASADNNQAEITQTLKDYTLTYDGQSIKDPSESTLQDNWVRVRVTDTGNYVRCGLRTTGDGFFHTRMEEVVDSSIIQTATVQITGHDWSAGFINMTIVCAGTTITMYPTDASSQVISLTGVEVTEETNITLLGAPNAPGDNARWDNIIVHV